MDSSRNIRGYRFAMPEYQIGLACLLLANICFFTTETIAFYLLLEVVALSLIFFKAHGERVSEGLMCWKIEPAVVWIVCVYTLVMVYGTCFLRSGDFNWDAVLLTGISVLALYLALDALLRNEQAEQSCEPVIVVVAILVLVIMFANELPSIGKGPVIRLGDSLSGNVNTAGVNMGMLSVLLAYFFAIRKNKVTAAVLVLLVFVMLFTGSKKTLVFAIADIVIYLALSNQSHKVVFIGLAAIALGFAVFIILPLYDLMGSRIQGMLLSLAGGGSEASRSTFMRLGMIMEGFEHFLDYPLFGGGEKYFATITQYGYEYSHCNYTELLCNYGLFGFVIYYSPVVFNTKKAYQGRSKDFNGYTLIATMTAIVFLTHWMMVVYSGYCVEYLPMIAPFVIVRRMEIHQQKELDE